MHGENASIFLQLISGISKWCSLSSLCGLSVLRHLWAGDLIGVRRLRSPRYW